MRLWRERRQPMTGHVMRHPAPMKGRAIVGIAPLSGQPRDAEGRVILDWQYAPKGVRIEASPPAPEPTPAPKRGVRAEATQSTLL